MIHEDDQGNQGATAGAANEIKPASVVISAFYLETMQLKTHHARQRKEHPLRHDKMSKAKHGSDFKMSRSIRQRESHSLQQVVFFPSSLFITQIRQCNNVESVGAFF